MKRDVCARCGGAIVYVMVGGSKMWRHEVRTARPCLPAPSRPVGRPKGSGRLAGVAAGLGPCLAEVGRYGSMGTARDAARKVRKAQPRAVFGFDASAGDVVLWAALPPEQLRGPSVTAEWVDEISTWSGENNGK